MEKNTKTQEKNEKKIEDFRGYNPKVTKDAILNKPKRGTNLYMLVWQRAFNSGIGYVWAKSELHALNIAGFSPKFVKHTVVKIDPGNLPVVSGKRN